MRGKRIVDAIASTGSKCGRKVGGVMERKKKNLNGNPETRRDGRREEEGRKRGEEEAAVVVVERRKRGCGVEMERVGSKESEEVAVASLCAALRRCFFFFATSGRYLGKVGTRQVLQWMAGSVASPRPKGQSTADRTGGDEVVGERMSKAREARRGTR
jgi:hypothetical protein